MIDITRKFVLVGWDWVRKDHITGINPVYGEEGISYVYIDCLNGKTYYSESDTLEKTIDALGIPRH